MAVGSAPLSTPGTSDSSKMNTQGWRFLANLPPPSTDVATNSGFLSKGEAHAEGGADSTASYLAPLASQGTCESPESPKDLPWLNAIRNVARFESSESHWCGASEESSRRSPHPNISPRALHGTEYKGSGVNHV